MTESIFTGIETQPSLMNCIEFDSYPNEFLCDWDSENKLAPSNLDNDLMFEFPIPEYCDNFFFETHHPTSDPMPIQSPTVICDTPKETITIARKKSISSLFSEETAENQKETIDDQLKFILESVKRPRKVIRKRRPVPKDKKTQKFTRYHKTKEQLNFLQKNLDELKKFNRAKVRELAEITGLSRGQVYKWYWDNKKKTTETEVLNH